MHPRAYVLTLMFAAAVPAAPFASEPFSPRRSMVELHAIERDLGQAQKAANAGGIIMVAREARSRLSLLIGRSKFPRSQMSCGLAMNALYNIAISWSEPPTDKKTGSRWNAQFIDQIKKCEDAIGISQPRQLTP